MRHRKNCTLFSVCQMNFTGDLSLSFQSIPAEVSLTPAFMCKNTRIHVTTYDSYMIQHEAFIFHNERLFDLIAIRSILINVFRHQPNCNQILPWGVMADCKRFSK
jgi:hypothetical protein